MTLDEQLLFQRQAARLGELEMWLAMMIARHGMPHESGWQYRVGDQEAALQRAQMPRGNLAVSIDYDLISDTHVLDAL
jgi:hypothetical protein